VTNNGSPQHARIETPAVGRSRTWIVAGVLAVAGLSAIVGLVLRAGGTEDEPVVEAIPIVDPTSAVIATPTPTPQPMPSPTPAPTPTPLPAPTPTPYAGLVDPASVGQPYGSEVTGLLTFRGNPTRTFYGQGSVPSNPRVQWSYPPGGSMCGRTGLGGGTEVWCGTGWTGQPAIVERDDATWAVFGAYDYNVHFLDASNGEQLLSSFRTGDIIKGSVTIDPDGYPLVYSGSRDNFFHVIAVDRDEPAELWRLGADAPGSLWNNDWDGAAIVIDDYLFEGGENSIFHVVKLNRGYDEDGLVTVDPEVVFTAPGYDDELIANVGSNVSIENSVALYRETVYFANSGGLVQGWDVSGIADGIDPERVFRYWVGDDVDATIVIDEDGALYVGVEYERGNARAAEVGQIVKLDPSNPEDPLVWSVFDNDRLPTGVWATPALYKDLIVASTDSGRMIGIDRFTGEIRWEIPFNNKLWSSPVIVDDTLIQADCGGTVWAFDVADTMAEPRQLWSIALGSCIESTPAVWDGRIIVGTRAGQVHMLSD
jgi:hypothetical protein